jgi:hypothetical protein
VHREFVMDHHLSVLPRRAPPRGGPRLSARCAGHGACRPLVAASLLREAAGTPVRPRAPLRSPKPPDARHACGSARPAAAVDPVRQARGDPWGSWGSWWKRVTVRAWNSTSRSCGGVFFEARWDPDERITWPLRGAGGRRFSVASRLATADRDGSGSVPTTADHACCATARKVVAIWI